MKHSFLFQMHRLLKIDNIFDLYISSVGEEIDKNSPNPSKKRLEEEPKEEVIKEKKNETSGSSDESSSEDDDSSSDSDSENFKPKLIKLGYVGQIGYTKET